MTNYVGGITFHNIREIKAVTVYIKLLLLKSIMLKATAFFFLVK